MAWGDDAVGLVLSRQRKMKGGVRQEGKDSSSRVGLSILSRQGNYCRAIADGEIDSEGFFFFRRLKQGKRKVDNSSRRKRKKKKECFLFYFLGLLVLIDGFPLGDVALVT